MLILSGFELYPRLVPLIIKYVKQFLKLVIFFLLW